MVECLENDREVIRAWFFSFVVQLAQAFYLAAGDVLMAFDAMPKDKKGCFNSFIDKVCFLMQLPC